MGRKAVPACLHCREWPYGCHQINYTKAVLGRGEIAWNHRETRQPATRLFYRRCRLGVPTYRQGEYLLYFYGECHCQVKATGTHRHRQQLPRSIGEFQAVPGPRGYSDRGNRPCRHGGLPGVPERCRARAQFHILLHAYSPGGL